MLKEQNDARPVSNNDDMKYYERKRLKTLPRSFQYRGASPQQNPRTRVKFEPKYERPMMPNGYEKSGKEMPRKKEFYQAESASATSDSEYESILGFQYDNNDVESEQELFDNCHDYDRTLNEMESKINAKTNKYFRSVTKTLSDTLSKLNLQPPTRPKQKFKVKTDNKAAGDSKGTQEHHVEDDVVIERILKIKTDCYKKIDQNLQILQKIDDINDKLYKNYITSGSKN